MQIADIAYLAGIIDGEGSIMYTRNGFDKRRNKYYYRLVLRIATNDKILVDWVLDKFPGKWYVEHKKWRGDNAEDSYIMNLHHGHAEKLIDVVLPYLLIKKPQAKLAKLIRYYHTLLHGGPKSRKYDKHLEPIRAKMAEWMRGLNYRGKGSMAIRKQVGELLGIL